MTYRSKYMLACFIRDFANLISDYSHELACYYSKEDSPVHIDEDLLNVCIKKEV